MRTLPLLVTALLILGPLTPSFAKAASAGDLIKCSEFPAVYYLAEDGKRYVFPNENMFFSWYPDFEDVKTISCDDLASIMIGGTVVYQAGTRLVKIPSVATVFAVEPDGVLRAIQNEEQAVELFGTEWAKRVDDVPESFWPSFSEGEVLDEDELPEGMLLENDDGIFRVNSEGEAEEIDTVLDPDQEDVLRKHVRDIDEVERLIGVALALIRVDAEHAAEILAEVLEKLKAVDVDDEDEIEVDEIDEIEGEDDAKEDAEDAIEDAKDEIERAIEEIAEAASKGDNISEAQVKLDEANAKLAEAEALLASGDWGGAEEQADEAKHDAMHARGKYIRSLDVDEDGIEDEGDEDEPTEDEDSAEEDAEDISDDSTEDADEDESDDRSDDDSSGNESDDDTSLNS